MLTQVGAQDAAAKVRFSWVFAVASVGPFMAALDNLMVTTAVPMIMNPPHASLPEAGLAGQRGWHPGCPVARLGFARGLPAARVGAA